jgi:hypothetical protein
MARVSRRRGFETQEFILYRTLRFIPAVLHERVARFEPVASLSAAAVWQDGSMSSIASREIVESFFRLTSRSLDALLMQYGGTERPTVWTGLWWCPETEAIPCARADRRMGYVPLAWLGLSLRTGHGRGPGRGLGQRWSARCLIPGGSSCLPGR